MKLKELRLLNQVTQTEIAKYLGVTQSTYNYYEKSKTEPDISTLKKLADYFQVSVDYLIEHQTTNQFDVGYTTKDQQQAIKMLLKLNQLNFVKAVSYMAGLYASQN